MIILENMSKKFGSSTVLKKINLKIEKGENVAIIGANGSGKTTLVEIICGIQKSTEGKINYTENINEVVGIQFQEGTWPPKTRAIDLIEFFKGRNWRKNEYVSKIFSIFEIDEILKKDINKMSGGQKQRMNCFLAIINDPTLIVIDELITGLDLKMQIRLLKYFEVIKKEKARTLIIVSHIPDEIETLCDRVILLKDGEIFEDILLENILKKHKNVRKYLESYFEENGINYETK